MNTLSGFFITKLGIENNAVNSSIRKSFSYLDFLLSLLALPNNKAYEFTLMKDRR